MTERTEAEAELLRALKRFHEAMSLSPLDAAAKYGPDFDLEAFIDGAEIAAREVIAKYDR